jgi:hypothetical protein
MKPNKDFFIDCNEGGLMSPPEFERTFCNQCKNRECVRAGWAFTKWDKRILTQADRLLINPNIVSQNESSRWEGISDFNLFNEPQTIEVWGVPKNPVSEVITPIEILSPIEERSREEEDTIPAPPIEPPQIEGIAQVQTSNPLNTPAQEIMLEGETSTPNPRPKRFQEDPWSVTNTLSVGGKFKMGK